jgi:hypothetical protein
MIMVVAPSMRNKISMPGNDHNGGITLEEWGY